MTSVIPHPPSRPRTTIENLHLWSTGGPVSPCIARLARGNYNVQSTDYAKLVRIRKALKFPKALHFYY